MPHTWRYNKSIAIKVLKGLRDNHSQLEGIFILIIAEKY